ncbi:MAG: DUF4235 domain-containing protein [Propionibacteriaceae bacterium]|nr:DUF4235 domain-containing protein [Propionibacteriaceae bacterium]
MDKVIVEKVYTALMSAAVTFAAGFVLKKAWKLTTGAEPPDPEDPSVPTHRAVIWFLASGVGVGMAQLFFHRAAAKRRALPRS